MTEDQPKLSFKDVETGLTLLKRDPADDGVRKKFGALLRDFTERLGEIFAEKKAEFESKLREALLPFTRDDSLIRNATIQIEVRNNQLRSFKNALSMCRQQSPDHSSNSLIRVGEMVLSLRDLNFFKS